MRRQFISLRELAVFCTFLGGAFCVGLPQNIVSANLTQVAYSFGISDADKDVVLGGWMSAAFFLIGAPASVIITGLARSTNRRLFLVSLCATAVATSLLAALAASPWHLVFSRAVLGAATGALQPLLACVLGELYPPAQRPAMASFVSLSTGGGAVVGQILSALLSVRLGWRLTFLGAAVVCGAGTLAVALSARFALTGPPWSEQSPTHVSDNKLTFSWETLEQGRTAVGRFLREASAAATVPTARLVYAQALFGTVPWAVLSVFLADFLVHDRGATPEAAALLLAFGLGAVAGGIAGGFGGSWLYRRVGPAAAVLGAGLTQACAAPPLLWVLLWLPPAALATWKGAAGAVVVAGLGGLFSAAAGPNIKALLLNTSTPPMRSAVFALGYLIDSLAKGVAPVVIGLAVQGQWLGSDGGRGAVLGVGLCGWVASGGNHGEGG